MNKTNFRYIVSKQCYEIVFRIMAYPSPMEFRNAIPKPCSETSFHTQAQKHLISNRNSETNFRHIDPKPRFGNNVQKHGLTKRSSDTQIRNTVPKLHVRCNVPKHVLPSLGFRTLFLTSCGSESSCGCEFRVRAPSSSSAIRVADPSCVSELRVRVASPGRVAGASFGSKVRA